MAAKSPRFVAKVFSPGARRTSSVWGVYDRERGSWPVRTPELGEVPQNLTEEEAVREAQRLEELTSK